MFAIALVGLAGTPTDSCTGQAWQEAFVLRADERRLLVWLRDQSSESPPAFQAEIDRDALTLYARYGYIQLRTQYIAACTNYPPVIMLPSLRVRRCAWHCYWNALQVAESGLADRLFLSDVDAVDELDRLLRDAVSRRMIADVPLGALLSGGVDSSVIVALMQAQSSRQSRPFLSVFKMLITTRLNGKGRGPASWHRAHRAVCHAGRGAGCHPRLPELYDEPFADSSQIPTYLVCELARRHVTVSLSGMAAMNCSPAIIGMGRLKTLDAASINAIACPPFPGQGFQISE